MDDKGKRAVAKNSDTSAESLPALIGRLGDSLITLLDTKLSLLKIELKEDLKLYVRNSIVLTLGGLLLVMGFVLLNIAIAFLIAALFEKTELSQPVKYACGFILTGLIYLVVGALAVVRGKNRLQKQNLEPEGTLKELEKDKQWLKEDF